MPWDKATSQVLHRAPDAQCEQVQGNGAWSVTWRTDTR